MHWFGGSIAEAVTLSKQRNAIFVVFVEDENELSVEMTATIDDTEVVSRLSDPGNFLAVKLKSGSPNYTHFAQIYQFVPVPSLFFIGRNGTPLEVVCAGVEPNNLATRIDRILQEHHIDKQPSVQPSTSAQHIKEQTVNLLQSEATANTPAITPANIPANTLASNALKTKPVDDVKPETSSGPAAKVAKTEHHVTKSGEHYEVVCMDDVCVRRPVAAPTNPTTAPAAAPAAPTLDQPGTSQATSAHNTLHEPAVEPAAVESSASIEEKLDKAKELIEARRREKADKEKELERQKELERRSAGQGVAELKRWQADQELKQIQEERKREKMENNLARQRILDQIAQDRAERRARDAPIPPAPSPLPQPAAATAPAPATSGDAGSGSRIQFKLPDGTSHTATFRAVDTLHTVHNYVADNLQMSSSSFSLWTAFPRHELTESSATLRQLKLAPSAALLVMPRRNNAALDRPSHIATFISFFSQFFTSFILDPSQQLYTWLRLRLFPPRAPSASGRSPSPPPRAPPGPLGPGARRRGNIHRLPGDRNSDDENNTWNGNSTQQM